MTADDVDGGSKPEPKEKKLRTKRGRSPHRILVYLRIIVDNPSRRTDAKDRIAHATES